MSTRREQMVEEHALTSSFQLQQQQKEKVLRRNLIIKNRII
jgi:hypothetical protein